MQRQSRKNALESESSATSSVDSPYRKGTWTVTMLKDELRHRQLPITGKKCDLIDRLENSPVKTGAAPNGRRSPAKSAVESPMKRLVEGLQAKMKESPRSPMKEATRGRSSSPSPRMLTRSRSTSLTRGTFLTWTRNPFSVIGNFLMAQVDQAKRNMKFVATVSVIVLTLSCLLFFNSRYQSIFMDQFARAQPTLQVFVDGFVSALGLNSSKSAFSSYISRASRFMYDCSAGNIERNLSTGRLRCSASPLKALQGGLPGRLFWLTREQFLAWSFGSAVASVLTFAAASKARTALPFITTNKTFREFFAFFQRRAFIFALLPFEIVGLFAGFSGFEGKSFTTLVAFKTFVGVPLYFASKTIFAKYASVIASQLASRIPSSPVAFAALQKASESVFVFRTRQAFNAALYIVICAAAVQVIANTRLYKNLRSNKN